MVSKAEQADIRLADHKNGVLAQTAMLYYKEGLTQNEIALRQGVSRATVNSYLRLALERNIVDIRISGEAFTSTNLSRELKDKFKLKDAYLANVTSEGTNDKQRKLINHQVARVGAMALHDIVEPGDIIGSAWGETMQYLSENVPYRHIENVTICQLIGSMDSPLISTAESVAIKISSKLGADCYTLHAPAVLSTPELAVALRKEPAIQNQLKKFKTLTRAIFSVGNCDANTPMVQMALTTNKEFNWYREQGAVGVLCGSFIDKDGEHIHGSMDERMIGVDLNQIKALSSGILVAGGSSKWDAIHATLKGGYVSHLITDDVTASWLINEA
ncbi:MAG: sugar-binding transcriptional regulator [Granulosicoccus sp.]